MEIKNDKVMIEGVYIRKLLLKPLTKKYTDKNFLKLKSIAVDLYMKGKSDSDDYRILSTLVNSYINMLKAFNELCEKHDELIETNLDKKREEINE